MARVKNIDIMQFNEKQLLAIELMAMPQRGGLTMEQVAEKVGISYRQFYRWRKNPDFRDAVAHTALENIKDDIPDILAANVNQAKGGNAKHTELFFKLLGLMVDRAEVEIEDKSGSSADLKDDIKRMREMLENKGVK